MRIAYISAGAGGMFCGSCLHDNTLAAALVALGHDALLIPLYTPLHTDEPNVSEKSVFLGGINAYLQQKMSLFRHTPRFFDWLLKVPVLATLQGDDVFLEALPEPSRSTALQLIAGHCREIDGFIATSRYYADFMAGYLHVPRARIDVVYPGLNLQGHGAARAERG